MICSLLILTVTLGVADSPGAADTEFFEKKVRPILVERCQSCHGARKQRGDLRLDSRAAVLAGGKTGPAIVPGKPDESPMIEAILYEDATKMPPKSKLPDAEIAVLTKWVEMGAPWPVEADHSPSGPVKTKTFNLAERARHWSFQPIRRVDPPAVQQSSWPLSPIDHFLLAAMEAKGLKPAPEADRRTLIRRLSFDLIGLPPTAMETDAFLKDFSPDAYEKLVDRLLASPAYGERWARHWLDLVRYGETSGHEFDYDIPDAWRYRDYVVRAMNLDLPYNQFLIEHVAGDLLASPRRNPADGTNESVQGTGFYFLGEGTHSPVDVREDEIQRIDNQIDVLSKTFLGLTVSCARCHDHKFDAITTKDYYALTGFLRSSRFDHAAIDPPARISSKVAELKAIQAEMSRLKPSASDISEAAAYLGAARQIPSSDGRTSDDAPSDVVFEDFEGPSYRGWKATGNAFGDGPIHLPVPDYQGEVASRGQGLVGSHNGRFDGSVSDRDALTGTLTSPDFTIDRDYIHFLVGGGSHRGRTCVNLLVDGREVATATGRDRNRMEPRVFDVRSFRGKVATLEVVDRDTGSWGNISLDHVVFSDQAAPPGDPRRNAGRIAKRNGLDPAILERWINAARTLKARVHEAAPREGDTVFEDFEKLHYDHWTASGDAFGDGPSRETSMRVGPNGPAPVPAGVAHSGLVSDRLQGTLRSRTFVIKQRYLHVLAHGLKGKVHVVVDGFEKIRDPIYGELVMDVRSDTPEWRTRDLSLWIGQNAYLEIADGSVLDYSANSGAYTPGDGYIAVDEIRFSDHRQAPSLRSATLNPKEFELTSALEAFREGRLGQGDHGREQLALVAGLVDRGLVPFPPAMGTLLARYREIEPIIPSPTLSPAICDGTGEDEHVLIRGSARMPGEVVPRRFLEAIAGPTQPSPAKGSGRMELAHRMLDPSCPLPARVLVNRLWKHHFGVGIVKTPDDFGVMGQPPSHPELLDWLASEFISQGWSLKAMHRSILTSRAYRMNSALDPEAERIDPTNRLLHRMNVRRLEAEAIRDSMLFISGRLDPTMGGPGVSPYLTAFMEGRGRPSASGPLDGEGRRSLYLNIRRNFLSPMLLAFDFPAPASTMGCRNVSNVPAQALTMLNDPFVLGQAKLWAERLLKEPGRSTEARLDDAYQSAFGRLPDAIERAESMDFLAKRSADAGEVAAWSDLCHVMFNIKEFLFIP